MLLVLAKHYFEMSNLSFAKYQNVIHYTLAFFHNDGLHHSFLSWCLLQKAVEVEVRIAADQVCSVLQKAVLIVREAGRANCAVKARCWSMCRLWSVLSMRCADLADKCALTPKVHCSSEILIHYALAFYHSWLPLLFFSFFPVVVLLLLFLVLIFFLLLFPFLVLFNSFDSGLNLQ